MYTRTFAMGLAVLSLALAGPAASGQEPATPADPVLVDLDARISQFLEGVSMGQAQTAYQELLAGSQLLRQSDALKGLIEKTNELEEKYGRYRAFEKVAAKRVGGDLVMLKYLYKCEDFPVVWYFTFYRTPDGGAAAADTDTWRVITVRFDTELELLAF